VQLYESIFLDFNFLFRSEILFWTSLLMCLLNLTFYRANVLKAREQGFFLVCVHFHILLALRFSLTTSV